MPPVAVDAEDSFLPEYRSAVCDWRSPADYAYVADLTNDELAWEFLRRCPEYREDVQQWYALQIRAKTHRTLDGGASQEEADTLSDQLCGKWQLAQLEGLRCPNGKVPPVFEDVHPWRFMRTGRVWIDGNLVSPGFGFLEEPTSSVAEVRIDLDRPLEPQLQEIRAFLSRLERQHGIRVPQEPAKDVRRSKNDQLYLRILDGLLQGVSQAEVEPVLYRQGHARAPGAIYDDAKRAKWMAEVGYIELLFRKVRK